MSADQSVKILAGNAEEIVAMTRMYVKDATNVMTKVMVVRSAKIIVKNVGNVKERLVMIRIFAVNAIIVKKEYGGRLKRKDVKKMQAVNLSYFEINADKLLEEKLIEKQGDVYIIDVKSLGFDKVLGCGKLTRKCRITAPVFSKKSAERIKKAGGEAIQLNKTAEEK